MCEPNVTTDGRVVANGNASQHRGIRVYGHVVLDDRVTGHVEHIALLIVLEALGTKGNTLIEGHVVADDTGLTNHHTRTVVNREIFADPGTRVDVDTRLRVGLFSENSTPASSTRCCSV